MTEQLLRSEIIEVIMTEEGESKEEIVAKVFRNVQREIYQILEKPIIQVETEEVYFDEIREVKKEKGVFSKGKKEWSIQVRILLRVKYLEIEKEH